MRPTPEQLLASLRLSLSGTIMPEVEDRWARYVGSAMDLVLQHLQLRAVGEMDAVAADSADMVEFLAGVGLRAAQLGTAADSAEQTLWASLARQLPSVAPVLDFAGLASVTATNEQLRGGVVDVIRWLDEHDGERPAIEQLRDDLHQLVRRQVDRTYAMVEPMFMAFGPAVAS